jgi:hypothetical protein
LPEELKSSSDVGQYLINIVKFQDKQKEVIADAKAMFTR